mmetsp:Transcript_30393/g.88335  ORF Transcript_30393/g.88335 Transcript_30393/m.88335 type:complete len:329 (-) Transcript_30393:1729-2715(-)
MHTRRAHTVPLQHLTHSRLVGLGALKDEPGSLAEEGVEEVDRCREAVECDGDATVAAEGHLQHCGDQPAVRSVVARGDEPLLNQLLHRVEGVLQRCSIDVRALVADLSVAVGEAAAAQTPAPQVQVDQQQHTITAALEVGHDGQVDVGARRIHRYRQLAGGLDRLLRYGVARGHGQTVFASIDGHADLNHEVREGLGSVVHIRRLALHLCGPHPVARCLDVLDSRHLGPHEVSQRLSACQPAHGGTVEEALDGLLADGRRATCRAEMALGNHCHIGESQLQRPDALLLCDEARDGPVDFVGEEPLRPHGAEPQHTVKRTHDRHISREL